MPFEDSGVSDPATGKQIAVSISLRVFYRKKYPEAYGSMPNKELNRVIGEEFAKCSSNIIHYFRAGKGKGSISAEWAEIRKGIWSTRYFISLMGDKMYVVTMQDSFFDPQKRRTKINNSDDPVLFIDSLRAKRKEYSGMHSPNGNSWSKRSSAIMPGLLGVPGEANSEADEEFLDSDDLFHFFGGKSDPIDTEDNIDVDDILKEYENANNK